MFDRQHLESGPDVDAGPQPVPRLAAGLRPDPAGVLRLQRTAGNAAVGRLLARQPTDTVYDPFLSDDELEQIMEADRQERAHRLTELRERILDPLDRSDAMGFISALRGLDTAQRVQLQNDDRFWTAVRRRFRGLALWSIQLTVEYGPRKPHQVNAVSAAIHSGDWRRTRHLIFAYPDLKTVVGIRQAIASKFEGRESEDLQRVLSEQAGTRTEARRVGGFRVHYEDGEQERHSGAGTFTLVRMGNHVRVIVRINLTPHESNPRTVISDESVDRWESGIDRYWNGKFRLRNRSQSLDVYFIPVFVFYDPSAHHNVNVHPDDGRSSRTKWFEDDSADTAAHEFGHMIGNPDEYNLPGTMAEIDPKHGLSDAERRRSSYEGITGHAKPVDEEGHDIHGLMGRHSRSRAVSLRHADYILQVFNARLTRPGEGAWTAELR